MSEPNDHELKYQVQVLGTRRIFLLPGDDAPPMFPSFRLTDERPGLPRYVLLVPEVARAPKDKPRR